MKYFIFAFFLVATNFAMASTRKALVVGSNFMLQYADKDAQDVATRLTNLGFDVDLKLDLRIDDFKRAIEAATFNLNEGDTFLFYYSGHAIQYNNVNYLIPNDTDLSQTGDIETKLLNINFLMNKIQNPGIQKIIILDACRNLPGNIDVTKFDKGLLSLENLQNSFTAYSTTPGRTASDRYPGLENSPFTDALLKNLERKGDSIDDVFNNVRYSVITLTDATQVPWSNSSLYKKFCFADCNDSGTGGNSGDEVNKNNPPSVDVANRIVLKLANSWMMEMANSSVSELVRYFSFPILNYFGQTNYSREAYINEMRGYFGMWTKRSLDLKELGVTSNSDGQKKIFVNLVYRFNFTNAKGREVKGKSTNTIIFEWIKGKYLITNTSEKVGRF